MLVEIEVTKLEIIPEINAVKLEITPTINFGVTGIEEAPLDALPYARKDGEWVVSVEEAPNDGKQYAREGYNWTKIQGGEFDVNLTINKTDLVWEDGFIKIAQNYGKEIVNPQLKVRTGVGYVSLTPIITFPSATTNLNDVPNPTVFQGFLLSDSDNLLNENLDIETLFLSYNVGDTVSNNYDSKVKNLGRNFILQEFRSAAYHSQNGVLTYQAVYPNSPHQVIETIKQDETLNTGGVVNKAFIPTFCEKYEGNIIGAAIGNWAAVQDPTSNPNILIVGSHGANSDQYNNSWRHDITTGATEFLNNCIAVGARPDDISTVQGATSYGFGLEFFEPSCVRLMNKTWPDKILEEAAAEVKIDATGLIVTSTVHPTFGHYLTVGDTVWVTVGGVKYQSTVATIVSDSEIIVSSPLIEITASGVYLFKLKSLGDVWGDLDLNFATIKCEDGVTITNYDGNTQNTFANNLEIGDEVWVAKNYGSTKYYTNVVSKPNAWTVVVSPSIPVILPTIPVVQSEQFHIYHRGSATEPNKGEHYWQSPTTTIISCKFQQIQDATDANWSIIRKACRATAKKTVNGVFAAGFEWDMYRGFGIIQVEDAIQWINDNYRDDNSRKYLADKHEFAHGLSPFLTYDDLLENSPMSKKMLDEKLDGFIAGSEVHIGASAPTTNTDEIWIDTDEDYPESYTKAEIDNLLVSVYKFKGSVDNYASLPTEELENGYVYNVIDTGMNYAYVLATNSWDALGGIIEIAKATALNDGLFSKEDFIKLAAISGTNTGDNVFSTDIEADKLSTTKVSAIKTFYDWAAGKFATITDYFSKTQSDARFVNQNGGTIYHTSFWISGTTVSTNTNRLIKTGGSNFTSAMVGAKVIINGEERIISSYIDINNVDVSINFSRNYSGITFNIYSYINKINYTGGYYAPELYDQFGNSFFTKAYDRIVFGGKIADSGNNNSFKPYELIPFRLSSDSAIAWGTALASSNNADNSVRDTGLRRNSAGILEIYDGVSPGNFRDLKLRSLILTDNTTAASSTNVGSQRYRADANNSYLEMVMQTGASTYAWVIIKQNTW